MKLLVDIFQSQAPLGGTISQAATGGVGFLMNRKAEKALCDVTSVTSRILKATFAGNPEVTLVTAYSPTNMRQNHDETESFYDSMRDT